MPMATPEFVAVQHHPVATSDSVPPLRSLAAALGKFCKQQFQCHDGAHHQRRLVRALRREVSILRTAHGSGSSNQQKLHSRYTSHPSSHGTTAGGCLVEKTLSRRDLDPRVMHDRGWLRLSQVGMALSAQCCRLATLRRLRIGRPWTVPGRSKLGQLALPVRRCRPASPLSLGRGHLLGGDGTRCRGDGTRCQLESEECDGRLL